MTFTSTAEISSIIVPQSAIDNMQDEPYHLVQALINYVNHMQGEGLFTREELPPEALQAYHTDYYLAQVRNGGHAQFVGNAGGNLKYLLVDIGEGLRAMGASEHFKLFAKMARWTMDNPAKAASQTGFDGGIAPELAALDAPFYALQDVSDLVQLNARWIASLPNLMPVDDARLSEALQAVAAMHPKRAERARTLRIKQLDFLLTEPVRLGLGMAAMAVQNREVMFSLGRGAMMEVEGEQEMVWSLQTSAGRRFGLALEEGAALFECIQHDNSGVNMDIATATWDDINAFKAPEIGRCLSTVEAAEIAQARENCATLKVAAALDLMLAQLPSDIVVNWISVRATGQEEGELTARVIMVCNDHTLGFYGLINESVAALFLEPNHEQLVTVDRQDIEQNHDTYTPDLTPGTIDPSQGFTANKVIPSSVVS